ncbi:hypothetical protein ABOM_000475, partial [Aspergillus bombycis]
MRFLAVFALMASVVVARPAEANIQASCQGVCLLVLSPLNVGDYCNNNGTAGPFSCCTPLKCGNNFVSCQCYH